ncbi:hypothetical protein LUZ60_005711 [Juncus effusus]|nr:hypothetical protein LUZ60_005711 [Juncus effusus]
MNPTTVEDHKPDAGGERSPEYAPYPTLSPQDVAPPPPSHTAGSAAAHPSYAAANPAAGGVGATAMPAEANPYVTPVPSSASKNTMDTVKDVLGKFGKKVTETAKKTEDLAGNMWQHLKTGPSIGDAAMGRIAHTTKVITEGGYEKIFQQTFAASAPDEKFKRAFACYLSTSAGPVMGVLYVSTHKLAFCSDSPLSYKEGEKTEWSYYKVMIPLGQLRSANPSASRANPNEKYIQVVSNDNHEFWFMGFVNYDSAVKTLQEAVSGPQAVQL